MAGARLADQMQRRRRAGGVGARTAKPSIAELSKGWIASSAATSSYSVIPSIPSALRSGTVSAGSGLARASTRASASSRSSGGSAMALRFPAEPLLTHPAAASAPQTRALIQGPSAAMGITCTPSSLT